MARSNAQFRKNNHSQKESENHDYFQRSIDPRFFHNIDEKQHKSKLESDSRDSRALYDNLAATVGGGESNQGFSNFTGINNTITQ